jgi:hypothetical protein
MIPKRVAWFVSGAVAGVAGAGFAKRKVKTTVRSAADRLAPRNVLHSVSGRVRDALHEGRMAMHAKEHELRARYDGRVSTLADDLDPGDEVLVGGRPVEPGQVIVLKQVRDRSGERRRFRA